LPSSPASLPSELVLAMTPTLTFCFTTWLRTENPGLNVDAAASLLG
jgi:hypothetical protein